MWYQFARQRRDGPCSAKICGDSSKFHKSLKPPLLVLVLLLKVFECSRHALTKARLGPITRTCSRILDAFRRQLLGVSHNFLKFLLGTTFNLLLEFDGTNIRHRFAEKRRTARVQPQRALQRRFHGGICALDGVVRLARSHLRHRTARIQLQRGHAHRPLDDGRVRVAHPRVGSRHELCAPLGEVRSLEADGCELLALCRGISRDERWWRLVRVLRVALLQERDSRPEPAAHRPVLLLLRLQRLICACGGIVESLLRDECARRRVRRCIRRLARGVGSLRAPFSRRLQRGCKLRRRS
mmetsp:Transcript_10786/g.27364  ORF Transcript_10786/g.27364 Transcript_10786/m.27364 type:complete len:297 (-) Transcript_10786:140-1030(-)